MNAESRDWLRFAEENLQTATLCLSNGLINPCLHNSQQAVEKALKALGLQAGNPIRKTHSIELLKNELENSGIACPLDEEECELLDAVYLPSKYPLGLILPDFDPDEQVAQRCVAIAERIVQEARKRMA